LSVNPVKRALPELIGNEEELLELLTRPGETLLEFIRTVSSPLIILGAGGKMGPTLAVLARRAADQAGHPLEVIAVSRFSDESARQWTQAQGVRTLHADLLERQAVENLPDAADVIYLVGLKFGTQQNPALTWAANTLAPAHVAQRYAKSRVVALSTGNVYPLVPVKSGGAREDHPLTPLGEYANAAVARERMFEYFTRKQGTRIALLRLSYAVEMRYGVLLDIASRVYTEQPIDLTCGYFNCIWQGDANEIIVRALKLASDPPAVYNLTGPLPISVRDVVAQFSRLFQRQPKLNGVEAETALLSNTERLQKEVAHAPTPLNDLIQWTAHWVKNGGRTLNRPTHFQVRDGAY
jgi:nucleoside-diphosphate-sugar epimerase